ncbi:MAG: fasciclin domain-containing protein [Bacteroidales bacterium]|nr:fasciclin domain-containing protein [Bacteroidales bacterium]
MKISFRILLFYSLIAFIAIFSSCEDDRLYQSFYPEENLTITSYLESQQEHYSYYLKLLEETDLSGSLSAYNAYGNKFTLFLPSNTAFEEYFSENNDHSSIDELISDKEFMHELTKYHIVVRGIETNDFPFGSLSDTTVTGDYLTISIDTALSKMKVNGEAYIIDPNIELINGYIHVIDKVLTPVNYSIYEWLLKQTEFSIFREALELTALSDTLMSDGRFTLLVEKNNEYYNDGINNIEDLKLRYSPGNSDYTSSTNDLYQYVAYHIVSGIYYLDDFEGKSSNYNTYASYPVRIDGNSLEIKINEGVEVFDSIFSSEDTTYIEYIGINYESSNHQAENGSIHLINNLMELFLPARTTEVLQFYNEALINDIKNIAGETEFTQLANFEFIKWTGTDVLTYRKSDNDISGARNDDYINLDGDFTFSYTIPKILPGKYNFYVNTHALSDLNATISIFLDGKPIGGNLDLTTGGRPSNNYYNFLIGTVEFEEYSTHLIEISTLIPGRFRCDRFEFKPIN